MESCPAEVLHQICSLVNPRDAAALRLSCRAVAVIAEHYIVRGQIRFNLSADSLRRLEFISQHPIFSLYVTKIYYEANILLPIMEVRDFSQFFTRGSAEPPPDQPPHDCSSREIRLYERNVQKWRQGDKGLSKKKLQEQYEQYTKIFDSQLELIRENVDVQILSRAMTKFPRLAEISVINIGRCKHALSERFWEQFPDGFRPPMSVNTKITVRQLDSILRSVNKSSIRVLNVKTVSPKIFSHISANANLTRCFTNLHKLCLVFRLEGEEAEALRWEEPDHLYRSIRKGQLQKALSHAGQLRDLSIHFDDCCHHPHSFASLKHILGDYSWPHLKNLNLSRIDCTAEEIMDSLKRQPKLTNLALACVTLTSGSWSHILSQMRSELKLQTTVFEGWFSNTNMPDEFMIMDYVDADMYMHDPECFFDLSSAIDLYVCDEMEDDNPALRLEDFVDVDELRAEMELTESEFDVLMTGM